MNAVTAIRTPSLVAANKAQPAKAFTFKGKNAIVRNAALAGVATLAYVEGKSRAETIAQLRLALGAKPSDAETDAAKLEYVVGRVAFRLADSKLSVVEQLAKAREIVTQYAAPVKDGVKARKLRAGQTGRRTPDQHKIVRAAEEAWSQVKAELGLGAAQTQAERNKAKRAPAMKGATARGAAGKGISHAEAAAVKGPAKSEAEACDMIATLTASLLAYANKNAKHVPTAYGQSIRRFHGAIMELAKARAAAEGTEA